MIGPGFTGGTLDRAERIRGDEAALAAAVADPAARLLRLEGYDPVLAGGRLCWTSIDAAGAAPLLLLGLDGAVPCFAAITGERASPQRSPALLTAIDSLSGADAAIYAAARAVLDWHARHGFCANCGAATRIFRAGWGRRCPVCATEHFPRTDPVVIMIAEHGDRALLGRQPSWPTGRYSALAGFLEPGESIEEAVAREIAEEAGVRVGRVRYVASQPWPFPHSLMIACIAEAEDDAISLDDDELEDAIWVPRADVRAVLAGQPGVFLPPPHYAIAHSLLSHWAAER